MARRSFREADHLPHNREGGRAPDPRALPRQRRGTTPQMHGRYPDYDVMANAGHWDDVTRRLIEQRVASPPERTFFDDEEARCIGAFCDVVLAQDAEPRVPVLDMVDHKLATGRLDGYHHVDMPEDPEVWRIVRRGLDHSARERGCDAFSLAPLGIQQDVVGAFSQGELSGGPWEQLNVATAWSVLMRGVLSEFYSHPWAWNEIGFSGPAYPRGYMRLELGAAGRELYEAEEAFGMDPVRDAPGGAR